MTRLLHKALEVVEEKLKEEGCPPGALFFKVTFLQVAWAFSEVFSFTGSCFWLAAASLGADM
jgi:hypothetical protein